MILTRNNVPKTGKLTWAEPLPAYPEIKTNIPYEIYFSEDVGSFIKISSGFLGLNKSTICLTNGEMTADVLSIAIYTA